MIDLISILAGMTLGVAILIGFVERNDDHPAARILWFATLLPLYPLSLPLAEGYGLAIIGTAFGEAIVDYLDHYL